MSATTINTLKWAKTDVKSTKMPIFGLDTVFFIFFQINAIEIYQCNRNMQYKSINAIEIIPA